MIHSSPIIRLFQAFHEADLLYLVMKNFDQMLDETFWGDLDIYVHPGEFSKLHEILQSLGWFKRNQKPLRAEEEWYYYFDHETNHLYCLNPHRALCFYFENHKYFVPNQTGFFHRRWLYQNSFYVPAVNDFEWLLLAQLFYHLRNHSAEWFSLVKRYEDLGFVSEGSEVGLEIKKISSQGKFSLCTETLFRVWSKENIAHEPGAVNQTQSIGNACYTLVLIGTDASGKTTLSHYLKSKIPLKTAYHYLGMKNHYFTWLNQVVKKFGYDFMPYKYFLYPLDLFFRTKNWSTNRLHIVDRLPGWVFRSNNKWVRWLFRKVLPTMDMLVLMEASIQTLIKRKGERNQNQYERDLLKWKEVHYNVPAKTKLTLNSERKSVNALFEEVLVHLMKDPKFTTLFFHNYENLCHHHHA